jgi:hypothetical protein
LKKIVALSSLVKAPVVVDGVRVPRTIEEVNATPRRDKLTLDRACLRFGDTYPLNSDGVIREIVLEADRFARALPFEHILVLGQSLAWMTKMAGLISPEINDRMTYVPFSGKWLTVHDNAFTSQSLRIFYSKPTHDQVMSYRGQLTRLGVTPEKIVDRFESTGLKTVVADYMCTGESVASFMEIMTDWAHEEGLAKAFREAMSLLGYTQYHDMMYSVEHLDFKVGSLSIIPISNNSGLFALTMSDESRDRVVPSYTHYQWTSFDAVSAMPTFNRENRALIHYMLIQGFMKHKPILDFINLY